MPVGEEPVSMPVGDEPASMPVGDESENNLIRQDIEI